jgi:hypothetical protein
VGVEHQGASCLSPPPGGRWYFAWALIRTRSSDFWAPPSRT